MYDRLMGHRPYVIDVRPEAVYHQNHDFYMREMEMPLNQTPPPPPDLDVQF